LYVFNSWVLDPYLEFINLYFNQTIMNMKKYLLLLLLLSLLHNSLLSQVSLSSFTETTETYAQITGTASTAAGDDGVQTNVPIGFTFNFGGLDYTAVGISTNGVIRLGTSAANTGISSGWTNLLSTTSTNRPLIAPFWDDNNLSTGSIVYATTGAAPNRVFTVNYQNIKVGGSGSTSGAAVSMLIRLKETSNVIEVVYSSPFTTTNSVSASVGLNDLTTFLSVTPANPSTASSATANNSINATVMANLAGRKLVFTPPAPPTCFVPSLLPASAVSPVGATLNWTAASPAPSSGYQWEVRTSGSAGSGATGLVASGSTAAGVTTANVSGLTPGTSYTAFVRSNCGAGDFSNWTAPQAFATPCYPVTIVSEGFEDAVFPPSCWSLAGTSAWLRATNASGYGSGTASTYANFYSISSSVPFDIITPPFEVENARLKFDHAYATYQTEVDKLVIFYSTNGGSTYTQLVQLLGGVSGPLNTAGATTGVFVPNASQWASKSYDLPPGTNMIKFQAVSAWGNNLYIDNISVKEIQEGTLRGTITDCYTNAVIEGANVSVGSVSTTTNASGYFEFPAIDIGTFNMTVSKAGYFNKTLNGVNVFLNQITTQNACLNQFVDPPVNLDADVVGRNVQLDWDAPGSPLNEEWIKWDNGVNANAIGLTGAGGTFSVASRWPVSDISAYNGKYLRKIRFYANSLSATYTLKVWKGINAATLLHSQAVTPTLGWNEVALTSSILIDGTSEFWFGYETTHGTSVLPAGTDNGPHIEGKGNMIYLGGTWASLFSLVPTLTYNWNLAGFVSTSSSKGQEQVIMVPGRVSLLEMNSDQIQTYKKQNNVNGFSDVSFASARNSKDSNYTANINSEILDIDNQNENKAATATLTGYNIYRGTTKIASNITPLTYTDMNLTAGTYNYSVTAQYVEGESMPAGPVNVQVITCFQPTNITATNITTTTATIGWTPGASETSWEYVYGFTPLDAPMAAGTPTSSNSVNLSSLTAGRSYQIYVRSTCGGTDGNSTWAGPYTFVTECEPVINKLMETFEFTSPTVNCWLAYNQDGGGQTWTLSTAQNHTIGGSLSARHWYGASGYNEDGWLVSPAISIPSVGTTELRFWSYNSFPGDYGKNSVLISTGSPDPADEDYNQIWTTESVLSIWTQDSLDLSAYAGEVIYIAFRYEGIFAHGWYVDDVSVKNLLGATATPTDLSCFGSADGSIDLAIYGGVPPYNVFWQGPDGFSSAMQSLSGLAAGTYSYQIDDQEGTIKNGFVELNQPAAVPVPTVANLTVVYDGLVKTIVATAPADTELVWYDAAVGGEESSAPSASEAGIYTAWVAAVDLDGCESARVASVLTINKKALTVTADNKVKCQNTTNPELTYVFSGFITGEGPEDLDVLPVGATTALFNSLPGVYPITISGGESNNYNFVYVAGSLTVTASPIVNAGGPGFVCVSETFPIVAATASNYTTILWTTAGNGTFSNPNIVNPVYTPGSQDITNGTVVLTMTGDPGSTCSATDQVLLTIQNDLPVSVTIVLNTTDICIGTPVSFSAVPVNGGLNPSYQWKVNGTNAGTNDDEFTYIPNDGDVVTVVLTSSIGCALNNPATSNAIVVDVTEDLFAAVSITASATSVCDFTPVTFSATPVNGGTNPAYQWKVNGVNQGANAAVFTYAPLNGDVITVVITSNHPCAVSPVATSNAITMNVTPPLLVLIANPVNGGTVAGGGNFAEGTEVTVTSVPTGGWEFLNWKNIDGDIVSTDAVYTFTIDKCYEELTATFSSTAKIAGQIKYFNATETVIPSPNSNSVFYLQLFENGVSIGDRQLVKYNFETGLDSYYEYIGVESGKDYTLRLWEENTNNVLGNNWTWNNWGGSSSIDALIINYMTVENPILTAFPWIMPSPTPGFTSFATKVANTNNDNNITALDALVLMNRIVGNPGFNPFPGGAHNFQLGTLKLANHSLMAYPTAPSIMFSPFGVYNAASEATSVYYEALLTGLNDGLNVFNIYLTATGDVNASNVPGGSKSAELLTYENVISASVGDEILIPVRINQSAELGAITIGMNYNNQLIDVVDVIGYEIFNINKNAGEVHVAWFDHIGKSFGQNQEVVVLKAKVLAEINRGVRFAELLSTTEFANVTASVLPGISLSTSYVETSVTAVSDFNSLSLDHSIFPNPFNDYTNIHYTLPAAGKVSVVVYNHLGQEVKALFNGTQIAGAHSLRLNNYDLNGSGTYFYRIILEGETKTLSARGTIMMAK
jgi:hypothetical protein